MSVFSTGFCVSPEISEANFATLAVGWLIGIEKSTVLDEANAKELDKDDAWIQASSGESYKSTNAARDCELNSRR